MLSLNCIKLKKQTEMIKKIVLGFALILWVFSTYAQANAYKPGETLIYTASYYSSGAWTDIAQVTMKVTGTKYKNLPLYRLTVIAQTYKDWDSYFKIRDIYQSWINPKTGLPLLFSRNVNEGNFNMIVKYAFYRKQRKANVFIKVKQNKPRKYRTTITPKTFDFVSLGYYVRGFNFSKAPIGKVYPINIMIDGKLRHIKVIYKGKANINNKLLGKVKCYKLGLVLGDARLDNPNNLLYVTADKRKIPVFIKATIPVGNIQVRLSKASGLK